MADTADLKSADPYQVVPVRVRLRAPQDMRTVDSLQSEDGRTVLLLSFRFSQ